MRKKKEILTIIVGLLAALVIIVGQANYYDAQAKALAVAEECDTTQAENDSDEVIKIFSNDAISNVASISLQPILHFIADTYQAGVERIWISIVKVLDPTQYFEVLFQRIISPNAP